MNELNKDSKIVITCDHLIERGPINDLIDMVCQLYKNAEVYTLIHKKGGVLGTVEQRPIRSSYLSNLIKEAGQIKSFSFLLPSASKALTIPCSVDLVINITNGFSQCINVCKQTKLLTYIYDLKNLDFSDCPIHNRLFSSYVKDWAFKGFKKSNYLISSSDYLKKLFIDKSIGKNIEVLKPFIKLDDLSAGNSKKGDYYLINSSDLNLSMITKIINKFNDAGRRFQFIGDNKLFKKINLSNKLFSINPCNGELAEMIKGSVGLIDFTNNSFPALGLRTIAMGRPVYTTSCPYKKEFLGNEGITYLNVGNENKIDFLDRILNKEKQSFEASKMVAHAHQYGQIRFKARFMRIIRDIHLN